MQVALKNLANYQRTIHIPGRSEEDDIVLTPLGVQKVNLTEGKEQAEREYLRDVGKLLVRNT